MAGPSKPGAVRVDYTLTPQRSGVLRARQPTDDAPPAAAVTPALARLVGGVGRILPLRIGGDPVDVRVAAVVDRIPGTEGDALLADLGAVSTAIDTVAPGTAQASELWLDVAAGQGDAVSTALARRPFAVLEKDSRAAREADARRDPLGHGTLLALAAAALAALALAAAGLVLAIRADLRDDRGELTDLEAQGARPADLRRVVTTRATLVGAVGVAVGALAGVALALLVTRVVSVTARAAAPQPPLATTIDPLTLALGAAAFTAAAVAVVVLDDPPGVRRPAGAGQDRRRGLTPLVDLRDVFVVHPSEDGGVAALRGLTLGVERGEICVVLGPSGAGKSTLVRVVAGLERPSAGLALVDGLDVGAASASAVARHRARVVGYADQHYWRALSGDLTAVELVALPLGLRGATGDRRDRRARELLERVGLLERADARPAELSGGEQQRIALCAAVAHSPALVVADEPTGELDETTARGVLDLLAGLARDEGAAALVVSHDPTSAAIADRVVQVRDGRVGEERVATSAAAPSSRASPARRSSTPRAVALSVELAGRLVSTTRAGVPRPRRRARFTACRPPTLGGAGVRPFEQADALEKLPARRMAVRRGGRAEGRRVDGGEASEQHSPVSVRVPSDAGPCATADADQRRSRTSVKRTLEPSNNKRQASTCPAARAQDDADLAPLDPLPRSAARSAEG